MADKKLTIASVFNAAGAKEASTAFKNLRKEAEGLGKALEKLTATPRGQAFFAKAIIQNTEGMKKLKGVTQDTAKVMSDILGKSIANEKKALDSVNQSLAKYNDLYKVRQGQLSSAKASGDMAGAAKFQGSMGRLQGAIATKTGEQQDIISILDQLENNGMAKAKIAKIIGGVAAVAGAIGTVSGIIQQSKTSDLVNQAAITSMTANQVQQMQGGNFQTMLAMQDPEARKRVLDAGGTKAIWGQYLGKLGALVGGSAASGALVGGAATAMFGPGAAAGAGLGGIIGGVGGLLTAAPEGFNLLTGGAERKAAETQQTALQSEVQKKAYGNFLLNYVQNTGGSMVSAARRLGGEGYANQAAGLGIGLGFSGAQSAQLAQGFAEQGGMSVANQNLGTYFGLQKGRYGANMSAESAGGLISGLSYGQEGRAGAGQASIDFWSKAFSKGLTDAKIGEELGKQLTENISGEGGRRSSTGFLANAFAGVGEEFKKMFGMQMDLMSARELNRGGGFDAILGGKTSGAISAKGFNIAQDVLDKAGIGSGVDARYLSNALSTLSLKDIASGGTPQLQALLKDAGYGGKMGDLVKQFGDRSIGSSMNILFSGDTKITDKFNKHGGNFAETVADMSDDERRAFAAKWQIRNKDNGGTDYMSTLMETLLYSTGGKNIKGRAKGRDFGAGTYLSGQVSVAQEEADIRHRAFSKENIEMLNKAMADSVTGFSKLMEVLKDSPEKLSNFNDALDAVSKVVSPNTSSHHKASSVHRAASEKGHDRYTMHHQEMKITK